MKKVLKRPKCTNFGNPASGHESSYIQIILYKQKFILAQNWALGSLQKSSWTSNFIHEILFLATL